MSISQFVLDDPILGFDESDVLLAGGPPTGDEGVFFSFGNGRADGSRDMVTELGGKGAGLAEMTNLGVPVPPGFTISCRMCDAYLSTGKMPDEVRLGVRGAMERVIQAAGRRFGDPSNPLLVSVRSGAAVSMPGMLETVLNLGLNDDTVEGLAARTGNARFAYDSYRRFLQMYGTTVLGVVPDRFEVILAAARSHHGVSSDGELSAEELRAVVAGFKGVVRRSAGVDVPMDPCQQLLGAIKAVWDSWNLRKAVDYRRVHGIPDSPGTAVSVVAMVFGNFDAQSGTGVAFTRNPSTGAAGLYGEFLSCAQGEDVVAGNRTPLPIVEMERYLPKAYAELLQVQGDLERHYRDMQDIEFTVESGRLFVLQTRSGKRAAGAAVRIAHEMVREGLITPEEAIQRVQPAQLQQLLHAVIDESAIKVAPVCTGLPASPGAGSGVAVFDPDSAQQRAAAGEDVVLVREETTPEDFHGMVGAKAIVTARGGMTSHAAVVARGMGKCAVVGCMDAVVDVDNKCLTAGASTIKEGDWITVDGSTGRIFPGKLPTAPSELMRVLSGAQPSSAVPTYRAFREMLQWADDASRMKVRANADTPQDAALARRAGAQGIGLCRTEHMFFESDRIAAMREMIVARDVSARRRALSKILPMQRDDFAAIFKEMSGFPVTIRLLDPPLHEFLPRDAKADAGSIATSLGLSAAEFRERLESLRETNPMLGHRGCRLGITYPEITEMQARAIFEAAKGAKLKGVDVRPEIMVPLIATVKEFEHQRAIIDDIAENVLGPMRTAIPYQVGVMIELPRAAITAGAIAARADFFSFGTNDLTQTTLGVSRDDAGRFLPSYVEHGILPDDPFTVLDQDGVGVLVAMAAHKGRAARPSLKLGICGEHGGDPRSVWFFHQLGLDYVSCSPYRVPMARLAAAHAALADL
jgi:pyruvate,orthophosphate dikinase